MRGAQSGEDDEQKKMLFHTTESLNRNIVVQQSIFACKRRLFESEGRVLGKSSAISECEKARSDFSNKERKKKLLNITAFLCVR